jgi:hypothetical protein
MGVDFFVFTVFCIVCVSCLQEKEKRGEIIAKNENIETTK